MIDVIVSSPTIDIGRQGENLARNIYFDLSDLMEIYGEGTATLVHMRPSDQAPYICDATVSDGFLVWSPTSTDTAYAGSGKCELRWVVGDTLAKSVIYATKIAQSITADATVPTPYESWYDAIIDYIKANYAANGAPQEVREAIYTLLSKAAYTETGLTDELEVVRTWTAENLSITNNLTHVATNNSATIAGYGTSYTATLTANSGYTLGTVTVTMGGDDVTATVYSSGTITIPSVTGDIVIIATAVAAVASLSAVYTQSGTVYDTDALDTLKSDLVVTAIYSDSSTATIPGTDYTLSGTLSTGTSTITVSYGGKTTTFTVSVTHGDNSLYSWDFTSGLTDSKQGVVATTTATQTNGTGLIYNATNQYTLITGISSLLGKTVEIDVEEIGTRVGGNHRRLFLFYGTNSSQQAGFICNAGSTWKYYSGSAWDSSSIEGADASYFNGKTVKIDISATGAITVSRKDIGAADSTYEQVYTSSIGAISSVTADATHCTIGLSNGSDGLGNATISAMRIYEGA